MVRVRFVDIHEGHTSRLVLVGNEDKGISLRGKFAIIIIETDIMSVEDSSEMDSHIVLESNEQQNDIDKILKASEDEDNGQDDTNVNTEVKTTHEYETGQSKNSPRTDEQDIMSPRIVASPIDLKFPDQASDTSRTVSPYKQMRVEVQVNQSEKPEQSDTQRSIQKITSGYGRKEHAKVPKLLPTSRVNAIVTRLRTPTKSSNGKKSLFYKSESYVDTNSYSWKNLCLFNDHQRILWTRNGTVKSTNRI